MGLLALERARLVDMSHSWAQSTIGQYQTKIRVVRRFESRFDIRILGPAEPLIRPPTSPAIPIMWAQQYYALRPGRGQSKLTNEGFVSFATARGLRSAASQYAAWDLQIRDPHAAMDALNRPIPNLGSLPTDNLAYTYMTSGMSRRLGEESHPSHALLERHVHWIDTRLDKLFRAATTDETRAELARAATANLIAWLGWLRAHEVFSFTWRDMTVVEPPDGPTLDLPVGTGAVLARLLPETKSSPTVTADLYMAYTAASGLSLGLWLHRLRAALGYHEIPSNWEHLFIHKDGRIWNSHYFRTTYLLPFLHIQRMGGDAHLKPFDGITGKTLEEAFYSMHSYRRGARTAVSRTREPPYRKATPDEVDEHGRWRVKRKNMKMPQLYLAWDTLERLAITLFCM